MSRHAQPRFALWGGVLSFILAPHSWVARVPHVWVGRVTHVWVPLGRHAWVSLEWIGWGRARPKADNTRKCTPRLSILYLWVRG